MFNEFRKFIMRGSMIDMAVGIIIGAAFGKIIDSLVNDIIMPPVGLLLGNTDFTNLFIILKEGSTAGPYASLAAAASAGAITLNVGRFINTLVSFIIVALAVFMLIKMMNKLHTLREKQKAAEMPATKNCSYCYTVIDIKATRCPNCTSQLT